MLILNRYIGETIKISDDITIRILSIHDRQVRLGIDAPVHVPVHRLELYERIRQTSQGKVISLGTQKSLQGGIQDEIHS